MPCLGSVVRRPMRAVLPGGIIVSCPERGCQAVLRRGKRGVVPGGGSGETLVASGAGTPVRAAAAVPSASRRCWPAAVSAAGCRAGPRSARPPPRTRCERPGHPSAPTSSSSGWPPAARPAGLRRRRPHPRVRTMPRRARPPSVRRTTQISRVSHADRGRDGPGTGRHAGKQAAAGEPHSVRDARRVRQTTARAGQPRSVGYPILAARAALPCSSACSPARRRPVVSEPPLAPPVRIFSGVAS